MQASHAEDEEVTRIDRDLTCDLTDKGKDLAHKPFLFHFIDVHFVFFVMYF